MIICIDVGNTNVKYAIYDKDDLVRALKAAENEGVLVTTISPRGRVEYYALSLQN